MGEMDQLRRVQRGARQGKPFDAKRREKFLDLIREGYSRRLAAPASGVSLGTVSQWLASGRSETPKHPSHVEFAEEYAIAEAAGTAALYAKLVKLGDSDTKAALALLRARGVAGFGPRVADQAKSSEAEARLKSAQADRAELDVRMTRVRVEVAEAAARGGSNVPGFGLASLLGDEELSLEVRQTVAAWAVRKGFVAVERKDWEAA